DTPAAARPKDRSEGYSHGASAYTPPAPSLPPRRHLPTDGHYCLRLQRPDCIAFDFSDQTAVDIVMVTFMAAFAAVRLGQFDAVIFDAMTVPTCTPSAPITSICFLTPLKPVIVSSLV